LPGKKEGHTRTYDYSNRGYDVVTSTDAKGNTLSITYDSRGRVPQVTDRNNHPTTSPIQPKTTSTA
jgi:YD repeat-containing protein